MPSVCSAATRARHARADDPRDAPARRQYTPSFQLPALGFTLEVGSRTRKVVDELTADSKLPPSGFKRRGATVRHEAGSWSLEADILVSSSAPEDGNVRQIPVLLGVIQAVADDKPIRDLEADVLDLDVDLAPRRLAQKTRRA